MKIKLFIVAAIAIVSIGCATEGPMLYNKVDHHQIVSCSKDNLLDIIFLPIKNGKISNDTGVILVQKESGYDILKVIIDEQDLEVINNNSSEVSINNQKTNDLSSIVLLGLIVGESVKLTAPGIVSSATAGEIIGTVGVEIAAAESAALPGAAAFSQFDSPFIPVCDIIAGVAIVVVAIDAGIRGYNFATEGNYYKIDFPQGKVSLKIEEATEILPNISQDPRDKWYYLYYRQNISNPMKYYVGRSSSNDKLSNQGLMDKRYGHDPKQSEYLGLQQFWRQQGILGRWTVRGGEQWLIESLGGIENKTRCGNLINGVSKKNPKGYLYYLSYLTYRQGQTPWAPFAFFYSYNGWYGAEYLAKAIALDLTTGETEFNNPSMELLNK